MSHWLRFRHENRTRIGRLDGATVSVYEGNLFDAPARTGETLAVEEIEYLIPCEPSKMIGLVNNFQAAAQKQNLSIPTEPLYFIKPPSCFVPHQGEIRRPESYDGRVIYEGEIGIVIGKTCRDVAASEVVDVVFGYTCVNDVTALQMIDADESFAQWTRAKSFDTFGAFGPVICTDLELEGASVQTLLKGRVRQDYPISDMIFSPHELVVRISRDMTLVPGDVITCGTSVGVLPMKPGMTVEVRIEGIGTLQNTFVEAGAR